MNAVRYIPRRLLARLRACPPRSGYEAGPPVPKYMKQMARHFVDGCETCPVHNLVHLSLVASSADSVFDDDVCVQIPAGNGRVDQTPVRHLRLFMTSCSADSDSVSSPLGHMDDATGEFSSRDRLATAATMLDLVHSPDTIVVYGIKSVSQLFVCCQKKLTRCG